MLAFLLTKLQHRIFIFFTGKLSSKFLGCKTINFLMVLKNVFNFIFLILFFLILILKN